MLIFQFSTVSVHVAIHLKEFLIDMQQFLALVERDLPEFYLSIVRKVHRYKHFRSFAEQFFTILALQSLAPTIDEEIRELDMGVFRTEGLEEELEESYMLRTKEEKENSIKN